MRIDGNEYLARLAIETIGESSGKVPGSADGLRAAFVASEATRLRADDTKAVPR